MTFSSLRPRVDAPAQVRLSPAFVRLLRRALVGLAMLHLVFQLGFFLPIQLRRPHGHPGHGFDMDVYFESAMRLKQGADLYQPWPDYRPSMTPNRFFYSPPFLLLTRPLVELGYPLFSRVWLVLITAAFWVYAACLAKLATGRWNWKAALVFGMIIDLALNGDATFELGQFEPFMWMMFGLALTTRQRAGWLALATLVKIHPVWSLCLALHDGKARAWRQTAVFALPVLLLSLVLVGTHNWAMWWPATAPVVSQGSFHRVNWSLSFGFLRVAEQMGWLQASLPFPAWARLWLSACAVGAPPGTIYLARAASRELRLSLVASATILLAPLCWSCYYPLLLLPLAVWMGERNGSNRPGEAKSLSKRP